MFGSFDFGFPLSLRGAAALRGASAQKPFSLDGDVTDAGVRRRVEQPTRGQNPVSTRPPHPMMALRFSSDATSMNSDPLRPVMM